MQVSTHDQDTPAANKQHKIEDQLPEYFNHGRILAPLAGIIPDLSFNYSWTPWLTTLPEGSTRVNYDFLIFFLQENHKVGTKKNAKRNPLLTPKTSKLQSQPMPNALTGHSLTLISKNQSSECILASLMREFLYPAHLLNKRDRRRDRKRT